MIFIAKSPSSNHHQSLPVLDQLLITSDHWETTEESFILMIIKIGTL
jgi:hypothetical protein